MHRRIRKVDVSEYSTEETSEDIDTAQDEEVQYRSGRLERSSGNATVHLVNNSNSNIDLDSVSLSQAFAASGSYRMELRTCRKLGKYAYGVQKRRILSEMGQSSNEEDLKATIDKSKRRAKWLYRYTYFYDAEYFSLIERVANAGMKRLKGKLPSGSVLTALHNYDDFGDKLGRLITKMCIVSSSKMMSAIEFH